MQPQKSWWKKYEGILLPAFVLVIVAGVSLYLYKINTTLDTKATGVPFVWHAPVTTELGWYPLVVGRTHVPEIGTDVVMFSLDPTMRDSMSYRTAFLPPRGAMLSDSGTAYIVRCEPWGGHGLRDVVYFVKARPMSPP